MSGAAVDTLNAWQVNANKLGALTFERFAVRKDACGLYVKSSVKPYDYSPGPNNTAAKLHSSDELRGILNKHFKGIQTAGLYAQTADSRCRWFGIDLDCKEWYPEQEERANRNLLYAQTVQDRLTERGFHSIVEDSNGIGGYHVWVLLDAFVSQVWVYHFLQTLTFDAEDCGFGKFIDSNGDEQKDLPETFPKQADVKGGFGNWLRLPGRHHRITEHWSRFVVDGELFSFDASVQAWIEFPASDHRLIPEFIPPEIPKPEPQKITATSTTGVKGCREAAQEHAEAMPWPELLTAFRWQDCGGGMWRRPGKPSGGHSAQLNDIGLHVYSQAVADLDADETYGKWRFYVCSSGFSMEGKGQIEAARHLFGQEQADAMDKESQRAFAKQKEASQPAVNLSALFLEGEKVRSADRNNIGTVIHDDGGPTVCVEFIGKEGVAVLDKPRSVLSSLDGTKGTPVVHLNLDPFSAWDLINKEMPLDLEVIEGILRIGEVANVIASTKVGKSWFALGLAIAVATGRRWMGRKTLKGNVLLIDNELRPATLKHRIATVMKAMGIVPSREDARLEVVSLRGQFADIESLEHALRKYKRDEFALIILDAKYRAFGPLDENSNTDQTKFHNAVDKIAGDLNSAFVMIHHSTKGDQGGKSTTDVGSGGGSQSRAVDTHLIIRPHSDEGFAVLDAAVRSFAPVESQTLQWQFPLWHLATSVEPILKAEKSRGDSRQESKDLQAIGDLTDILHAAGEPMTRYELLKQFGGGKDRVNRLIRQGVQAKRIIKVGTRETRNGELADTFMVASRVEVSANSDTEVDGLF